MILFLGCICAKSSRQREGAKFFARDKLVVHIGEHVQGDLQFPLYIYLSTLSLPHQHVVS
jgi:hypothetical protein